MIKDMINELDIHCVYNNRGCQEILQLQHLDRHEDSCGFTPVVCTNEGCGAIVNKRDLIHHESEQCEYRKLKCHSCKNITITLVNMEKRIENMETNIFTMEKRRKDVETRIANLNENVGSLETKIERNIANLKTEMEEKLGAVNNEVKGLKTVLVERFDQVKDVVVKMEDKPKENTRKMRNTPNDDREKIFVAGGFGTDSVEIFNWSHKLWTPLQSLPDERCGATAFVFSNHVITTAGI